MFDAYRRASDLDILKSSTNPHNWNLDVILESVITAQAIAPVPIGYVESIPGPSQQIIRLVVCGNRNAFMQQIPEEL